MFYKFKRNFKGTPVHMPSLRNLIPSLPKFSSTYEPTQPNTSTNLQGV